MTKRLGSTSSTDRRTVRRRQRASVSSAASSAMRPPMQKPVMPLLVCGNFCTSTPARRASRRRTARVPTAWHTDERACNRSSRRRWAHRSERKGLQRQPHTRPSHSAGRRHESRYRRPICASRRRRTERSARRPATRRTRSLQRRGVERDALVCDGGIVLGNERRMNLSQRSLRGEGLRGGGDGRGCRDSNKNATVHVWGGRQRWGRSRARSSAPR